MSKHGLDWAQFALLLQKKKKKDLRNKCRQTKKKDLKEIWLRKQPVIVLIHGRIGLTSNRTNCKYKANTLQASTISQHKAVCKRAVDKIRTNKQRTMWRSIITSFHWSVHRKNSVPWTAVPLQRHQPQDTDTAVSQVPIVQPAELVWHSAALTVASPFAGKICPTIINVIFFCGHTVQDRVVFIFHYFKETAGSVQIKSLFWPNFWTVNRASFK